MIPARIQLDPWHPRADLVAQAATALRAGNILLVPTDTTWALICDAQQKSAVSKLSALRDYAHQKRNDGSELSKRPMALMCPDISSVGHFTIMDQGQFRLVKRLLPGPYTILLPVSREVPRLLREKRKVVGIRLPNALVLQSILEQFGQPVFTTTARKEDGGLLQSTVTLHHRLEATVDLVVESDPIIPQESTVLDATTTPPTVLRAGIGPLEDHWVIADQDDDQ